MNERVRWSAAVINYNGGELVVDTIASIAQLDDPPDEILLIDDGSSDDSVARVRQTHPSVRVIPMEHTGRPTKVRNCALRSAHHRYVLLSDNDIAFAPDAVERLKAVMLERPDAAVCTPLVVCDDDHETVYGQAHRLHFLCWGTLLETKTVASARAVGPHRAIGCGIQLIDRERAQDCGFFDGNMVFGWGDDGELHHRLHLAGWGCYAVPDALVFHRRLRITPRVYGQIHNRAVVLLRDYQLRTLILIAPALLVFEAVLLASALSLRAGGEYLRALRDVARKLGPIRASRRRVQSLRRVADREILCAEDLDLPRRFGRGAFAMIAKLLNAGFRSYWWMAGRLL